GLRLGRLYNVFATGEYAPMRPAASETQDWGQMTFAGLGFRFSSNPDDLGFLFELALGYRSFTSKYVDGTTLEADRSGLNMRVAVGADIRFNRWFSLSPQLSLSTGSFNRVRWNEDGEPPRDALTRYDEYGQYHVVGIDLGAHFDAF